MNSTPHATNDYIGVELSGPMMRAALISGDGRVIERHEAALELDGLVVQIARIAAALREVSTKGVAAMGVGVSGLVNSETGRILISSDLPASVQGDLQTELIHATGFSTVRVENDANCAAYGEYTTGAGQGGHSSMFYVSIGEHVGGAFILDGKLLSGASGFAGAIGHITIDPEGVQCTCGNIGCLETLASAPNIVRRTHDRLFRDGTSSLSRLAINRDFTAADIAREARHEDDFALMMLERTGRFIGIAIASVINLVNVERIIFGGEVMAAGNLILDPIIQEAKRRSFQPSFESTQITAASLGADAVPIGAAMLARDAA